MPERIADPKDAARFWSKVDAEDLTGCWMWATRSIRGGYGQIKIDGCQVRAHRMAYMLAVGPIPAGMQVDHTCHVPLCVNPAHLRLATPKQNSENRAGPARDNHGTGVRGVTFEPKRGKFRVIVGHHRRRVYGGRFDTLAEAEAAAIALRNRLFTHNTADRLAA